MDRVAPKSPNACLLIDGPSTLINAMVLSDAGGYGVNWVDVPAHMFKFPVSVCVSNHNNFPVMSSTLDLYQVEGCVPQACTSHG